MSAARTTRQIDRLNCAGKTQICKEIHMGISGLSEEDSRAFFQSKGWANSYTVDEIAGIRELNARATRTVRARRGP